MKLDVWFNFSCLTYSMGDLFTPDPLALFLLIGSEYTLEIENNIVVRHSSIQESIEADNFEVQVELLISDTSKIVIDATIINYGEEDDNKLSVRLKVGDVKLWRWFEEVE